MDTPTPPFQRTIVASDRPEFVQAVCEWIESDPEFIVVATAKHGFAALVTAKILRPDLMLVDVAMSGMDGVEVTRRVKALAEPPIVVLVALQDVIDIVRVARDAGADAIITRREPGERIAPDELAPG